MKKIFTTIVLGCTCILAVTQPTITYPVTLPAPGTTGPLSIAQSSNPGPAGANVTWDFSGLTFNQAGTFTIVNPASTPFASSFPTADYGYSVGNTYSYFNITSDMMEVLAYSITQPGTGNDYSSNPRTMVKFPFSFGNTASDTWQKAGGSVNTVTLTYDGYGTLKTPTKTYQNVVRIKETYGNGDDYQWFILNPFMTVMVFDHNVNMLYWIGASATGIEDQPEQKKVSLFPVPSAGMVFVQPSAEQRVLEVMDGTGRMVMKTDIPAGQHTVDLSAIQQGAYIYRLYEGSAIETGKIILQ